MTKTVDRILTRGLLLEPLPPEAIATLPDDAIDQMRRTGLEDIALGIGDVTPISDVQENSKIVRPYLGIDEVNEWYQSSLDGLARGLATLDAYRHFHSSRPPDAMDNRFYENAALNLGQAFYQSVTLSTGIHLPIANRVAEDGYKG